MDAMRGADLIQRHKAGLDWPIHVPWWFLAFSWGICDVEDCSSGALYLAKQKLVDVNRLCITGGSAGGYTTLASLAFTDTFKAGEILTN